MLSERASTAASFGLGTYRLPLDNIALVLHAVRQGCRLIDTAPNYGGGKSQEVIGRVLHQVMTIVELPAISTKVGFIPSNQSREELIDEGIIESAEPHASHELSPKYIRFQAELNLAQLGCAFLDYLFLHNPENLLKKLQPEDYSTVMRACFEECETLVDEKKIGYYGIATWAGFLDKMPVSQLVRLAQDLAGEDHHLSALQLPLSLVNSWAVFEATSYSKGPLIEAENEGISVFASSPLHGGALPRMITPEFGRLFGEHLTPAQCALQYVRSIPFVDYVLLGARTLSQLEEALALWEEPSLSVEQLKDITLLVQ